ncbi:11134_t:CDS:2 [Funneliformis geosporum]|nr:11134_t:CDS:2 [Funneliformis geosporum]
MKFKNYKAMENVPYCFIKDLEADSDQIENNIINEKTVKLQKQKPNSYGYVLMQTDGKLVKEIARRTPNSIAESWERGFQWLDLDKLPDIRSISPTTKRVSIWEVKLKYPDKLHSTHTEYPLCPEC